MISGVQSTRVDKSQFNRLTLLSQRRKVANKDGRKISGKDPAGDASSDSPIDGSVSPVGADSEEDSIEGALVNLVHQALVAMKLEAFSVHGHGTCSAWQRDAETAAGELERYSALKDLAVRGRCSRADIYIYVCLFVFTLVLLHMK